MEGAKPYVLTMPKRVAIPLLPQVKAELESNEAIEVITRVDVPVEWFAVMVVVPKSKDHVQICVDFT